MRMKKEFSICCAFIIIALAFSACSDLRDPVPTNSEPEIEVHPAGWLEKTSSDFHGRFLQSIGWNLRNCQQCHGIDYKGGIAESSCLTCHPATPEDCTVCHGGVDNLTGAPPHDLFGNGDVESPGVGVHTPHLEGEELSSGFSCSTCHIVPDSLYAPNHIDSDLPAEVVFSGQALLTNASPQWDHNTLSCSGTYCHGSWSLDKSQSQNSFIYSGDSMQGNSASPIWIDHDSAECGTCHDLPPVGHNPFELSACAGCHGFVIDAAGEIIDKTKHANGLINVFGREFPMF